MTLHTRAEAAAARSQQVRQATDRPSQRRCEAAVGSLALVRVALGAREVRAAKTPAGEDAMQFAAYASVTEKAYDMWDFYGPYTEVVTRGAFEATLATSPSVEFVVNHGAGGGTPMAHTRNDTLTLAEDETGLLYKPLVDPTRSDVADMLKAYERGDLAESSFRFTIDAGQWSPDYTEFRINAAGLNRGDVSIVNFGANPHTADVTPARAEVAAPRDLRAALLAIHLAD